MRGCTYDGASDEPLSMTAFSEVVAVILSMHPLLKPFFPGPRYPQFLAIYQYVYLSQLIGVFGVH